MRVSKSGLVALCTTQVHILDHHTSPFSMVGPLQTFQTVEELVAIFFVLNEMKQLPFIAPYIATFSQYNFQMV